MVSSSVLLALASALSWGVADYLAARASKGAPASLIVRVTQVASLAFMAAVLPIFWSGGPPRLSLPDFFLVAFGGLMMAVSYFTFYRGLEDGQVSIVAPISYLWPLVAIPMGIAFFGEIATGHQLILGLVAVSGAAIASIEPGGGGRPSLARGAPWAIACLVSWGSYSSVIAFLSKRLGGYWPVFLMRIVQVAAITAAVYAMGQGKGRRYAGKRDYRTLILIGLIEGISFLLYSSATSAGAVAVVGPITALAPAITMVLAARFIGEKPTLRQIAGAAIAIAAAAALSF